MNWLDNILQANLPKEKLDFVNNSIFGYSLSQLNLPVDASELAKSFNIELLGYDFSTAHPREHSLASEISEKGKDQGTNERLRAVRTLSVCSGVARIGLFQNAIVEPTDAPIQKQKDALLEFGRQAISIAANAGVNIFCFQELWNMPFAFCTQKKLPWTEFAEDATSGETTTLLRKLAQENNMVIISSILERDAKDFMWNSAVIIDADGQVLGVARKNHIPVSGKFSETGYYRPSNTGIPVFHTKYAKIGLTICYDRHQMQNWYAHRLNQAEIVFNPTATVQTFSEPFWGVEARAAAAANGYYVCAINRVGTEYFKIDATKNEVGGPYFGSSYIIAPNGTRTPGLSTDKNGLLIADVDLSKCVHFKENLSDLAKVAKLFSEYH